MIKYVVSVTFFKNGKTYGFNIVKDSVEEAQDMLEAISKEMKELGYSFLSSMIESMDSFFLREHSGDETFH